MDRSHLTPPALIALAAHLCRGQLAFAKKPLSHRRLLGCVLLIVIGCGMYGFSLGLGRSWQLGLMVMVKLPLLVICTLMANCLVNGMLAQVLGTAVTFRQAFQLMLISFAIFSVIVGALTPVLLFFAFNLPRQGTGSGILCSYGWAVWSNTLLISWAALVAHTRALRLLRTISPTDKAAESTYLIWSAGNLVLGAQLAWLLRPFFGHPALEVTFFRPIDWHGNFYTAFYEAVQNAGGGFFGLILLGILVFFVVYLPVWLDTGKPPKAPKAS